MGGRIRRAPAAADRKASPSAELAKLRRRLAAEEKRRAQLELDLAASKRTPPPPKLAGLGPPPTDPLAIQAWMLKALAVMSDAVVKDGDMTTDKRSKEMRSLSAAMAKLVPKSRLYEAEQTVLRDQDELNKKASERRSAKLEKRPPMTAPAPTVVVEPEHGEEPQH